MTANRLDEWLEQCQAPRSYWYVKRLSGNDTQATGGHQAGPYIARDDAFQIFPELNQPDTPNPRVDFQATAASHNHTGNANIIWYNNRLFGGTRNETRVTRLGGQDSPLLDEDNTGAIALFFFTGSEGRRECHYWVCRDNSEEKVVETFAGPVEPGRHLLWHPSGVGVTQATHRRRGLDCWVEAQDLPPQWLQQFPSPQEVLDTALNLRSYRDSPPDIRLMRRRDCEYALFLSVEDAAESTVIREGFNSVDSFIARAQTILQRRKARSGRSLELQLDRLLSEEDVPYVFQPTTESGNRPDFIFPSQRAYDSPAYPACRLRMLAAKTTVKERWRQVTQEANRIQTKHLFTLQEGVSINQFAQMQASKIQLVVPKQLHSSYPPQVAPHLMTLKNFVDELHTL